MKENLSTKAVLIITGIIYSILGFVFIGNSKNIMNILVILLGISFAVYGLLELYKFFTEKHTPFLVYSILLLCAGIYFIVRPNFIIGFMGFSMGLFLILQGTVYLKKALDLRKIGLIYWYFILSIAILISIVGIYGIFNPKEIVGFSAILMGLAFLVSGISNMFLAFFANNKVKLQVTE